MRSLRPRKSAIRFLLRRMDQVGELERILDEKDWNVVTD